MTLTISSDRPADTMIEHVDDEAEAAYWIHVMTIARTLHADLHWRFRMIAWGEVEPGRWRPDEARGQAFDDDDHEAFRELQQMRLISDHGLVVTELGRDVVHVLAEQDVL